MNWTRGHTIGHGSTATVSAATVRGGDGGFEVFAVKSIELAKSEFLQREQKILSILSSPHIVGYKGYDISLEKNKFIFNLMMEYMPSGSLSDVIHKSGGWLKEGIISCYTRQIVQGLEYLHSSGIVHCDIKGRNILVSDQTVAKIADFGCAKWVSPVVVGITDREAKQPAVVGGTPLFMAPEVARGEDQGFAADIWALGCTIIEMATGGSPWPNATNATSLIYRIGFSEELPEIPDFLSEQGKDFLKKCLRRDPKQRWTAEQLLKHPFLEEFSAISKQNDQEFKTSSPTSILDQGIWNSMEESENLSGISTESSSDSPAKRLSQLSSRSKKPNWSWDESWITVRSRGNVKAGNEEMVVCLSLAGSDSHDMEVESSTADEYSRDFHFYENFSSKNNTSFINNIRKCTDEIFVISNLNSGRQNNKHNDFL